MHILTGDAGCLNSCCTEGRSDDVAIEDDPDSNLRPCLAVYNDIVPCYAKSTGLQLLVIHS